MPAGCFGKPTQYQCDIQQVLDEPFYHGNPSVTLLHSRSRPASSTHMRHFTSHVEDRLQAPRPCTVRF